MSFGKLMFLALILYSVVLIKGNSNISFVNTLHKLIQKNDRRLRVIRDLYSPKHSALSYRSSERKRLALQEEEEEKPILVVVMLNHSVLNDIKLSDFPMKTGKHVILSEIPDSKGDELEKLPRRVVKLKNKRKDRKRQNRIKRNSNLEHDNTKSDDMFNREKLDGTLRSMTAKDNDLSFTRRNMYSPCDQRSLLLCTNVCGKIYNYVCKAYDCSPNFLQLANKECGAICQEEYANGTQYRGSYDSYFALDAEDYYNDDRDIIAVPVNLRSSVHKGMSIELDDNINTSVKYLNGISTSVEQVFEHEEMESRVKKSTDKPIDRHVEALEIQGTEINLPRSPNQKDNIRKLKVNLENDSMNSFSALVPNLEPKLLLNSTFDSKLQFKVIRVPTKVKNTSIVQILDNNTEQDLVGDIKNRNDVKKNSDEDDVDYTQLEGALQGFQLNSKQKDALRKNWRSACDRQAARKCKKACKKSAAGLDKRKDFKRTLKKECKRSCKAMFIVDKGKSSHDSGSDCQDDCKK